MNYLRNIFIDTIQNAYNMKIYFMKVIIILFVILYDVIFLYTWLNFVQFNFSKKVIGKEGVNT
jgi:hypothetical protein